MNKKNLFRLGIVLVVLGFMAMMAYVYLNIRQGAQVEVVDQTDINDQEIINAIKNNTKLNNDSSTDTGIKTNPSLQTDEPIIQVKSGSFVKYDPAHFATGQAVIYETSEGPVLKFENFETPNGPDLFVYLATATGIQGIKASRGKEVSLGALKSIKGDQVYKLPSDYQKYNSVVIWCRAFDINFSSASLQ